MNEIMNKIITITAIESKITSSGKVMVKVKDTENKSYQIWKQKADGSESVAHARLQELGDPVGQTIEIGYTETQGDFNGKAITYKTIINIKPANGATPRIPSKADMFVKAQMVEAVKKTDDDKWAEISKGKVRHGVSCEFIRLGNPDLTPTLINKINRWTDFIITGEPFKEVEGKEDAEIETMNLDEIPF